MENPVPGGLTYREAHLLMEILGDSGKVHSIDVVEINPILDKGNHTAELAVELVSFAVGPAHSIAPTKITNRRDAENTEKRKICVNL